MIGRAWRKLQWSLAMRGFSGTWRVIAQRITRPAPPVEKAPPHPFDVRYGVDTGGLIGGGDLSSGHPHDVHISAYVGIPPSRFQATIKRWAATPPAVMAERYTFIDLGCGKGRAVLLASQALFHEVIGVELNPQLAQIGQSNLAIWQKAGHASRPARIVCADATEFAFPPGPCLIYLVSPFGAPVLRLLLQKLEAHVAAGGATIDVIYQNPAHEAVFAEFSSFTRLWSEVIPASQQDIANSMVYTPRDRCSAYRR